MNNTLILWPVLVQIALTLFILLIIAKRKITAIKAGEVDQKKTALHNSAWTDEVLKASNNFGNQFQTPVLFYALSIIFYMTNNVSLAVLILSWIYTISRLVHSYVHILSNYVPIRFKVFTLGVVCLMALTVILALKLV